VLHPLNDVRFQKEFDQRQRAAVGDLLLQAIHQSLVRNGVEIALQIGIHDVDVTGLNELVDSPQGIVAASPGTKSVAALGEAAASGRPATL